MGIKSEPHHSDSPSSFPLDQRKKKFWDPTVVLDIINPDQGCLTCIGYAPSCRRRCRNSINQSNRAAAFRLIDNLSYIDASTTDIKAKLHQLAKFALCQRYHQDQSSGMVEKWARKIDQLRTADSDTKLGIDETNKRIEELEDLVARLSKENRQFRTQYERRSTQEERARRADGEETRKSGDREHEQEREKRKSKERPEKERKEREAKEQDKRERTKREETRRREEQQAREREAREREERNERVRQRAEQMRREREQNTKEQAAKTSAEWGKAWRHYERRWDEFKRDRVKGTSEELRAVIPWPVKSGHWRDVSAAAVEDFYRNGPVQTMDAEKMPAVMKLECLKWHTDRIPRMYGAIEDRALAGLFNTVAQVAIKARHEFIRQRER